MTLEQDALTYAAELDKWLRSGPSDEVSDALVFGVGVLCGGGLSGRGFAFDLAQEIDEYEVIQVGACGEWIAFQAREAAAGGWLDMARAIMAPHERESVA